MRQLGNQVYVVDPAEVVVVQSRAEMRFETVDDYAEKMKAGVEFDPCSGVYDGEKQRMYVWDGCHRVEAAKQAGVELVVECASGTLADAEWLALTANAKHGLQRTQADIQRIVKHALMHPYAVQMTNVDIARHCGVSDNTIRKYRQKLEDSGALQASPTRTVTRKGQTYQQKSRHTRQPAAEKPRCLFCYQEVLRIKATLDPKRGICLACALLAARELATDVCDLCRLARPHCSGCCRDCDAPCSLKQACRKHEGQEASGKR